MDLEEIKNYLQKEKEETELILKQMEEEIDKLKDSNEFEISDISEQFEEKQDLYVKKELLIKKLENLKKALEKIEKGTYGICIKCGSPIEENRLKLDPMTEVCRNCAHLE